MKVKNYYPSQDQNDQATLIVYESGSSGHVKEVGCEFPPMSKLESIKRVKVGSKANDWAMGATTYFCEDAAKN